jgi:hypothetical protein
VRAEVRYGDPLRQEYRDLWIMQLAGLVIAVTRRRQLLCCRTSRPFQRQTISQAPIETAWLADFRRGWLYSRLRYMGPGTKGSTVRLNVPAACRDAAQATAQASASGSAIS